MDPVNVDVEAVIEQERAALLQQVKASFTGSSLTLLSIIMAVALSELASVVAGDYPHFTIVQWLMALVTLFLLIMVWDHLSRDAMTFAWVPDFRDSSIPFLIGAVELFLSYAVGIGIDIWLDGMAAMAVCGLIYIAYVHWRAEQTAENRHVLAYSRARWQMEWMVTIAGLILCPLLAVVSFTGIFSLGEHGWDLHTALAMGAVLLVGAWLAGYVLSTHLSWRATIERAKINHLLR